ncbi:MAG: 2OG-Fe(II) oxygenase [Xanthomonadales bacterium]|nr:2OG-Fe(II) oxygenase [Xanthomonadales bacterium]
MGSRFDEEADMPYDREDGHRAGGVAADFRPGRIAPDFLVERPGSAPSTFYELFCGRSTVVFFAPGPRSLEPFAELGQREQVLAVISAAAEAVAAGSPLPSIIDDGSITRAFLGVERLDHAVAVVLRPTLALAAELHGPTPAMIESILAEMPSAAVLTCADTAPVLMVPDVLSPSLCRDLVSAHEADNFESGMLRERGGQVDLVPDPTAKRRRDHRLADPALVGAVTAALEERLLPAIGRAFHYPVTHLESYKVVAYDARGGYFRLHRDNVTPDARHRRFALSLNLNAEYAGGELVFPEFGSTRYRPPAGAAMVFSGTLLHGVRDVTAGRRYVLLSFLWGDEPA